MRKPNQITVDRALLLYVLHRAEPHGLLSDVKLQQLCFLCELQMFGKGFKGFHFEFFRFAYGAFSKGITSSCAWSDGVKFSTRSFRRSDIKSLSRSLLKAP